MKDYYKILGVRATASPEDIHARWIELMRKFHPDRRRKGGAQDERIKEINEAYEVLKHSSARAHYDLQRTYYQKKRTLHLQRFILPLTILLVLLFLGLIYFQRPDVTPPPESTVPSVRRLISIKPRLPLNETNQINQTKPRNQTTPTRRAVKAKTSVKVYNPVPSRSRSKSRGLTTKINETNQTNEIDEINESNQTSPLFAKAKKPLKVQKPAPSPNQFNEINQINQIDETNQTNEINESNQINQINEPKFVTALDVPNEPNDPNALHDPNDPNELNHLSQLTPSSLIATEEEVKDFFALYRQRYNRKDIDALLSLFSPRAVQNGRDGFDEIKKIYSHFFDQSQELLYHMEDTRIEIFQNAVQVRTRYEIDQIGKKRGGKKVWRGEIRWILVKENRALKIRFLDYRPQESR
jgi:curved DNA-binding protein CbpA